MQATKIWPSKSQLSAPNGTPVTAQTSCYFQACTLAGTQHKLYSFTGWLGLDSIPFSMLSRHLMALSSPGGKATSKGANFRERCSYWRTVSGNTDFSTQESDLQAACLLSCRMQGQRVANSWSRPLAVGVCVWGCGQGEVTASFSGFLPSSGPSSPFSTKAVPYFL